MDAYQLVNSLTPAQQRYFRLYAVLYSPEGKSAKYLTAFDSVLAGRKLRNKPDEAELFSIVLTVMRSYTANGSAREVRNAIHDAEFLMSKAMYKEADAVLRTAERNASELELFGAQADIINLRAELMQVAGFKKGQSINQLLNAELTLIEHMDNAARFRQYSLTLFEKIRAKGKSGVNEQLSYLQHVLRDPLMKSEAHAVTLRSKIIRLQLHATAHLLKGDAVRALAFQKQLVALMNEHPAHVRWKPFTHVILLNNFAITALRCGKYREARNAIEAMRRIPGEFSFQASAELRGQIFAFAGVLELDMLIKRKETSAGVKCGASLVREMKPHLKYMPPSLHIVLLFNYANLLFLHGEIKKAYTQFSSVAQLPYKNVREDLVSASRLLQALCLYESGDMDHLSYAVINLKRQAKKNSNPVASEIALLNTIGKVIEVSEEKQSAHWEKLRNKLVEFRSAPADAALYDNFDILAWVEKRIRK
jgi:hypothetical protein